MEAKTGIRIGIVLGIVGTVPVLFIVSLIAVYTGAYNVTATDPHGTPGAEREPWAQNMRPQPPVLVHAATEWEAREFFWTAKHDIKMTGMPAFEPEIAEASLWGIAAFVKRLPGMMPQQYRADTEGAGYSH